MAALEGNATFKLALNDNGVQLIQEAAPFVGSELAAIMNEYSQAPNEDSLALKLPSQNLVAVGGGKLLPELRKRMKKDFSAEKPQSTASLIAMAIGLNIIAESTTVESPTNEQMSLLPAFNIIAENHEAVAAAT